MKSLVISLAVGASALLATAASAAPLSADVSVRPDGNIQNVRMVCNENGRCWHEHAERRGYYHDERREGVGVELPGVSVGIGTRRY